MPVSELSLILQARDYASSILQRVQGEVGKLERGLGAADRQGSSFMSNMMSTASGFVAANLFGRIADGIGSVVTGMIDYNAKMEGFTTTFAVFFQNQEKATGHIIDFAEATEMAKTRMAELSKFAATTPFELPQVVQAGKVLQAFGIYSEQNLTRFGNAASAAGIGIEEMSTYLGKLKSGQYGETFARLAELGVVTRAQLEMKGLKFDKGGSYVGSAEDAMTAVTDIFDENYSGMMEKQSKTFSGMMSNFKDFSSQLIGKIGAPLFAKLSTIMSGALEWLGKPETAAMIDNLADLIGNVLGGALDLAGKAFGKLIDIGKDLIHWFGDIKDGWDEAGLGGALLNFFDMLKDAGGKIVGWLGDLGGKFIEWIKSVDWGAVAGSFWDGFTGALGAVGELGSDIYDWVSSKFAAIDWAGIWSGIENLGTLIWDGFVAAATGVADVAGQVWTWLSEQWGKIKWEDVWSGITDLAKNFWDGFLAAIKSVADLVGTVTTWLGEQWAKIDWGQVWNKVTSVASGMAAGLGSIAGAVTTWLVDQWKAVNWATVWGGAEGPPPSAQPTNVGVTKDVLDSLDLAASRLLRLTEILNPFKDVTLPQLKIAWDDLMAAFGVFGGIFTQLQDGFMKLGDQFRGRGGDLTDILTPALQVASNMFLGPFVKAIEGAALAVAFIGRVIGGFSLTATTDISTFVSNAGTRLGELGTFIDNVRLAIDGLKTTWSDNWGTISIVLNTVKDILIANIKRIISPISDLASAIQTVVDNFKKIEEIAPWNWKMPSWLGGGTGGGGMAGILSGITGGIGSVVAGGLGAYPMTSEMGPGHSWGQDFATPIGTALMAPLNAMVESFGPNGAWGNQIALRLANGARVILSHLSGFAQTVMDGIVNVGEVIGWTGWTGNVRPAGPAGAHLDIQTLLASGRPIRPSDFFGIPGSMGGGGQGGGGLAEFAAQTATAVQMFVREFGAQVVEKLSPETMKEYGARAANGMDAFVKEFGANTVEKVPKALEDYAARLARLVDEFVKTFAAKVPVSLLEEFGAKAITKAGDIVKEYGAKTIEKVNGSLVEEFGAKAITKAADIVKEYGAKVIEKVNENLKDAFGAKAISDIDKTVREYGAKVVEKVAPGLVEEFGAVLKKKAGWVEGAPGRYAGEAGQWTEGALGRYAGEAGQWREGALGRYAGEQLAPWTEAAFAGADERGLAALQAAIPQIPEISLASSPTSDSIVTELQAIKQAMQDGLRSLGDLISNIQAQITATREVRDAVNGLPKQLGPATAL